MFPVPVTFYSQLGNADEKMRKFLLHEFADAGAKHLVLSDDLISAILENPALAAQLQKDIIYTYICQLEEQTEETFPAFQQDFAHYSKVLFAQCDNAEKYTEGFSKVKDFKGLDKYIASLKKEYATVKNDFLTQK